MAEINTQEDNSLAGLHESVSANKTADEATKRAVHIVANVTRFKKPKVEKIAKYRELYNNNVKRKYRQPFNVVLPVFAGGMDTLMSEFNDDLSIEMSEGDPSDYYKVRKFEALWAKESNSQRPWAKFPYKARTDRANALFSGRGFMMNYAVSEPEYRNHFEIYEFEDAIFQPTGGGLLEEHLYKGRTNLIRSKAELQKGHYDQAQVNKLINLAAQTDTYPIADEETRLSLQKFAAAGLDVTSNDYVGEQLFRFVEMVLRIDGRDYYLVFQPWYQTWVRFDALDNMTSSRRSPFVSWATHEDNRNFASKSYADDMYGVASAAHTLFNQELTSREKQNFGVKAYDPDMVQDVARMDKAFTRPDGLFAVNVPAGKTIKDAIFEFTSPSLSGTINLIEWMNEVTGREIGITDLTKGGVQNVSKKASVVFQEQQNVTKRLVLRSSSYTEAMGEIAGLFINGCIDHLPARRAVRMLGAAGAEGWSEIVRADGDLELTTDVDVIVRSSTIELQNSQMKKKSRYETLKDISADPLQNTKVNLSWVVEEKLRAGGEYDDAEIAVAMDTRNNGNRREIARAYQAISELRKGDKPDLYYAATDLFLEIIRDFALEWRTEIGEELYTAFMKYILAHGDIVTQNNARRGQQDAMQSMVPQQTTDKNGNSQAVVPSGVPSNNGLNTPVSAQ